MKRIRLLLLATLVATLACAGVASAGTAKQPALKITTLDGNTFDLAAQRGKWVIVNFWATWCSPCIKEMPDISAFVASHKDVVAIGLAFEDTEKAEVVAFAKAHPVSYPLALLDIYKLPEDFGAPRSLPTTYVIAPDGSIAKTILGPITATDLEKAIAAGAAK
ncbi:MAG: TlpA disulfide reductase family protein [Dokdonella sp.]